MLERLPSCKVIMVEFCSLHFELGGMGVAEGVEGDQ